MPDLISIGLRLRLWMLWKFFHCSNTWGGHMNKSSAQSLIIKLSLGRYIFKCMLNFLSGKVHCCYHEVSVLQVRLCYSTLYESLKMKILLTRANWIAQDALVFMGFVFLFAVQNHRSQIKIKAASPWLGKWFLLSRHWNLLREKALCKCEDITDSYYNYYYY